MASTGNSQPRRRRVLIIVENLPVPFDRRVWHEATTLSAHGYEVSVICPKAMGYEAGYEVIDGIHIFSLDAGVMIARCPVIEKPPPGLARVPAGALGPATVAQPAGPAQIYTPISASPKESPRRVT